MLINKTDSAYQIIGWTLTNHFYASLNKAG